MAHLRQHIKRFYRYWHDNAGAGTNNPWSEVMKGLRKPDGGPSPPIKGWKVYGTIHKDEITAVIPGGSNIGPCNKEARRRYDNLPVDEQKRYDDQAKEETDVAMAKYTESLDGKPSADPTEQQK